MVFNIAAFGALNPESYEEFAEQLQNQAQASGLIFQMTIAAPYPNAAAVAEPGRPLRAEALQNDDLRRQLIDAVVADARAIGADAADVAVMPCMSMIGFHEEIEQALGRPILKLSTALALKYKDVERLGILHMRPARQRIAEIFGPKAVTPNEVQSAQLLVAENAAKAAGKPAAVEDAMRKITEDWRATGLRNVLFARADAPKAKKTPAGKVLGVEVLTHFDILAEAVVREGWARAF